MYCCLFCNYNKYQEDCYIIVRNFRQLGDSGDELGAAVHQRSCRRRTKRSLGSKHGRSLGSSAVGSSDATDVYAVEHAVATKRARNTGKSIMRLLDIEHGKVSENAHEEYFSGEFRIRSLPLSEHNMDTVVVGILETKGMTSQRYSIKPCDKAARSSAIFPEDSPEELS